MLTKRTVCSWATITACDQSIISEKGNSQLSDNITGMQPKRSASKKRNEPRRRPRGVKQNVEFDMVFA